MNFTTHGSKAGTAISVVNTRHYNVTTRNRQVEDTIELLREKAAKMEATAVTGLQLAYWTEDGQTYLTAYGTAMLE